MTSRESPGCKRPTDKQNFLTSSLSPIVGFSYLRKVISANGVSRLIFPNIHTPPSNEQNLCSYKLFLIRIGGDKISSVTYARTSRSSLFFRSYQPVQKIFARTG